MNTRKIRILTFIGHYLPGFKAGGPIRSLSNLVEALGDKFEFLIVTSDRDLKEKKPYPGIPQDRWTQVGKAQVIYLSHIWRSFINIWKLMRDTEYDILYLNSFFSRRFSMVPFFMHKLGLTKKVDLILAPRGEFSGGAQKIKRWRKTIYIRLANKLGLYTGVHWHVSSPHERVDLVRTLQNLSSIDTAKPITVVDDWWDVEGEKESRRINMAVDLPSKVVVHPEKTSRKNSKEPGRLRMVFLSRVSRMKNLDGALKLMSGIKGHIQYDIYGPLEDVDYWKECQGIIAGLPDNIIVNYCGEVPHDTVQSVLQGYELFFLPTHGENYGHVIIEALSAGCPVLISDRTPWRGLEKIGVGWDVDLDDKEMIRKILQRIVYFDGEECQRLSEKACMYALERSNDPESIEQNRKLFRRH